MCRFGPIISACSLPLAHIMWYACLSVCLGKILPVHAKIVPYTYQCRGNIRVLGTVSVKYVEHKRCLLVLSFVLSDDKN